MSSPSLLHAPATNDQGLRPDEPGVGENRVCVGHQPEGLAVRSRGSSESSSATPGQHAHGPPDPEGVNVPFVIAHDEQPYRLLEQEEERYGVPVYRGCRRRASSTPRLKTIKAFGLKSRAWARIVVVLVISPKGWPFVAGGQASLRARPPDSTPTARQTPKGSTCRS